MRLDYRWYSLVLSGTTVFLEGNPKYWKKQNVTVSIPSHLFVVGSFNNAGKFVEIHNLQLEVFCKLLTHGGEPVVSLAEVYNRCNLLTLKKNKTQESSKERQIRRQKNRAKKLKTRKLLKGVQVK